MKHPREALRGMSAGASAADIMEIVAPTSSFKDSAMRQAKEMSKELIDAPKLSDETSDIEEPKSDVEEEEIEDEDRDELEHRAAGVMIDGIHLDQRREVDAEGPKPTNYLYAPLHFKVLRHIYRGRRHWSEDGVNIICPSGKGNFKAVNYREAETHTDDFCEGCCKAAHGDFCVLDPERYCYGKPVF